MVNDVNLGFFLSVFLQGAERHLPDLRVPVHRARAPPGRADRHDGLGLHHRHHLPRPLHRHLSPGTVQATNRKSQICARTGSLQ